MGETSLLSKEQSGWLKGLLILLIVLAHNGILMGKCDGMHKIALNDFLYSFHVYAFFFVTSLYNWKPLSLENVRKDFLKLYKPYLIFFFVILILVCVVLGDKKIELPRIAVAFFSGADSLIDRAIGMSFVWFLPTMFVFRCLLGIMSCEGKKYLKIVILVVSALILLLSIMGIFRYEHEKWAISGSWVALRVLSMCLLCRWLIEKFGEMKLYRIMILMGAVAVMVLYFYFYLYQESRIIMSMMKYGFVPFFMFQLLWLIVVNKKKYGKIISFMGRHSFEIYLIHLLMYNALMVCIKIMGITPTIGIGIVVFVATLGITIGFNAIVGRCFPKLHRFIYSNDYRR